MGQRKFKDGEKVVLTDLSPKQYLREYQDQIGIVKKFSYDNYSVEFMRNGYPFIITLRPGQIESAQGASKKDILLNELKKLEIEEGELKKRRRGIEDRLRYMEKMNVTEFRESDYRAFKVLEISADASIPVEDKLSLISSMMQK